MAWSRSAFAAGTSAAFHVADNSRSPGDRPLRRDPIGARALEVLLDIPELVQPLQVDRVLEAAGGVLQRELADLALDPRPIERNRTGPGAEAGDDGIAPDRRVTPTLRRDLVGAGW